MKKRTTGLLVFIILEVLCGRYIIYLAYIANFQWLLPWGIIIIPLGITLLTLKNWIRIVHIFFSVSFLILYFINYYDLLIRRGFITEVVDPFFLMGFVVHLPIILFNIAAIIFLIHIRKKFCVK